MGKLIIHNPNLLSPTIFLNGNKIGKALNRNNTYNVPTGNHTLQLKTFLLKSTPITIQAKDESIVEFTIEEGAYKALKLPLILQRIPSNYFGLVFYVFYLIFDFTIDIILLNKIEIKFFIKACFLISLISFYIIYKRTNCYINLVTV